eukprot:Tbor_TRINITY_DN2883_c0_g1::TRINITY_DN2883_c0_g1_i1::g.23241::m.23241/K20303/TRAPPC4, TRS23; trafficking protein particle complex subunit 4
MIVHLLWIINKSGQLIYNHVLTTKREVGEMVKTADHQMTSASVLYSLHSLTRQISPVPKNVLDADGLSLVEGDARNILIFETPTGIKFVLFTDPQTTDASELFGELYRAYADYVLKSPFYTLDSAGIGQPIRFEYFMKLVESIVEKVNAAGGYVPGR